ncbi:hypothetical protein BaRGS_00025476 [Batillaria attramentaria]|uniref:Uncharacterized protein n=1 Tax=Batillaria attramentaria TaxID=370345 RepID=A0ABD0K8A4_9CAEN
MAEGREYPVEYAVDLSLDMDPLSEELAELLNHRYPRYHVPGLQGRASFQQLNAKAAIAAAHHRAYIQVLTTSVSVVWVLSSEVVAKKIFLFEFVSVWVRLATDVWVRLATDVWVRLATDVWVRLATDVWVRLATDVWLRLATDVWLRLATDVWLRLATDFFKGHTREGFSVSCRSCVVLAGVRLSLWSVSCGELSVQKAW